MTRPTLEVADILRTHGDRFLNRYRSSLGFQQLKAFRAIRHCRTAALGGHRDACLRCGYQAISYNVPKSALSQVPDASASALAGGSRSSRTIASHCRDGLLHGSHADLWSSALPLCDWPRQTFHPAFQRHSESLWTLDCAAIAPNMAIRCSGEIPDLRPGLQVLFRSRVHRSGARHHADPNFIPQSLAERCCRTLGGKY